MSSKQMENDSSLDHTLRKELADLIEDLTTTGNTSLDPETMKKLKRICKQSDGYIEYAYTQLMSQLEKEHAEIRLSAFQVINELFQRSHKFRQLVVAEMQELLLLTVETDVDFPLPPPKNAATLLKEQTLRAIADWNDKYGKAYKKLGVGYNFLKHCKKVNFNNITARLNAERERERVRLEQEERLKQERFSQTVQQMTEILPEIEKCLRETETCYDILFPKNSLNLEPEVVTGKDVTAENGNHKNPSASQKVSEVDLNLFTEESTKAHTIVGEVDRTIKPTADASDSPPEQRTSQEKCDNHVLLEDGSNEAFSARDLGDHVTDPKPEKDVIEEQNECNKECGSGEETRGTELEMGESLPECSESMQRTALSEDGRATRPLGDGSAEHGDADDGSEDDDEGDEDESNRDGMQSHGVRSLVQNINIDIEIPTEGVALVENENNTDLIGALDDAKKLLETKYLKQVNGWIEVFKSAEKTQTDFFKKCLDMQSALSEALEKYSDLKIQRLPRVRRVEHAAEDSDDELEDVPEKEGFEPVIADHMREEYGLPPLKKPPSTASSSAAGTSKGQSSGISIAEPKQRHHTDWHPLLTCEHDPKDPTSRAATLASLGIKEETVYGGKRKLASESGNPVATGQGPSKQAKGGDSDLLSRAPVIPYGVDLEHWENPGEIKAPVILRPETENRVWRSYRAEEEVVGESFKEDVAKRVYSFTGTFVPVKWKCRAPLPSGKLCERMDRIKCPFHGKIIPRNEDGTASNKEDLPVTIKEENVEDDSAAGPSSSTEASAQSWQDPELLRDIEGATGLDLTVTRGRGKGKKGESKKGKDKKEKKKKYPGLTDLTERTNTSRNRLEKRVFNKSAMKRVNAKLTAIDNRRLRDKFSNQFHYALH